MDFFKGLSDRYNDIWKNIISPQRQVYFLNDLGQKIQVIRKVPVIRYDIDIKNSRGQLLKCTFYSPEKYDKAKIGCVIYLHGNAGSRIEALTTFNYLLPRTALFCFDFAGAGKSEGDYVTLGLNEAEDVALVVEYIKRNIGIQKIAIWGRSMGAATAINYCAKNPKEVVALALDSGFIKLSKILEEIGKEKTNIPNFLVDTVLMFIKNKINNVLNMDIFSLDLIEEIKKIKNIGGIIFASAEKDSIINSYHTQKLYDSYSGDKQIIKFDGDHNTLRPPFFFKKIVQFIEQKLYGQEFQQMQTLIDEEQDLVMLKEVNFNNEDQFIKAIQSIPKTLDKTDQLVEQCIKQLENLANPLSSNSQTQSTRPTTGSSSSDQQSAEYYLTQIYLAQNNQNNPQIKDKTVNNYSFHNSKKIKQLCTNVNKEQNYGCFQQQNTNSFATILPHHGQNQKRNSLAPQDVSPIPHQIKGNSPFQCYKQYQTNQEINNFDRKHNGIISKDNSQEIYQYNKGQINNTSYDEIIDHRKEDLLKRVFEEIDFNPIQPSPSHKKSDYTMTKSTSTKIIQNDFSQNRRNQDNISKSPTMRVQETTQEDRSPKQRLNEDEYVYMYTDFTSKVSKQQGRQFPQKLLKSNLLNENIGDNQQNNEGQIKVTFNTIAQQKIQNTQINNDVSNKLSASTPCQQNLQYNKIKLMTNCIKKTNRESISNINTNNGERILFGSLIESVHHNQQSPFNKNNPAENNMHLYKSHSFRENLFIEETEYVEDNLVTKETPKHFANIRTLQEIRGVDNRNEKLIPSMSQNEQHIQNLINKYKMDDSNKSPSNFNELQILKEEEKQCENNNNKVLMFGNSNGKIQQNLQQMNNQPVKQIQVTLQDQIQKFKFQQTNIPQTATTNKNSSQQQIDIHSYRRATLEPQNPQLADFYNDNKPQQIKIIGNNQYTESCRNNKHKEYQFYGQQDQKNVIGNRINISSIDKNSKNLQNMGNQLNSLNEPQISSMKSKTNMENFVKNDQNNISKYLHQQIVHSQQNHQNHHIQNSFGQHENPLNQVKILQKPQNEYNHINQSNQNLKTHHQHQSEILNTFNNNTLNNANNQNCNNLPQKNTQVRGVSLLSNQASTPSKIQQINPTSYKPIGQTSQNNINIQKYLPSELTQLKQNEISTKGEIQGVQILANNQNMFDYQAITQTNNQVNKQMMNSRNQSPFMNQSNQNNYQFQPSQPNQLYQKQMSNTYTQQNSSQQINLLNNEKSDYTYQASTLSKSTNNSVNPYSYISNKQMNNSQNLIPNIELQQRVIDNMQDQVTLMSNNMNYGQITPTSITHQSSHLTKKIDQSQINRSSIPSLLQSQSINKNPTNFIAQNTYQNTELNSYQNQIAQLNRSPQNQTKFNLKLDEVGIISNYGVTNGSGTDRSQGHYAI